MYTDALDGRHAAQAERKQDRFIHWPEDKAPRGSLKLGYYLCFLKCWTITPPSRWKIDKPRTTGIPASPGNAYRTKPVRRGESEPDYSLYREGGHLRILHQESLWSDKCNQPFFLRCWCHLEKQGAFLTKMKLLPLCVVPASHILMCHRE